MSKADPEKLVLKIVESIVDKKKEFILKKNEEGDLIRLEIKAAKEDIGKIIGKSGQTLWAIRRLAGVAGAALGKKVLVTLVE